MFELKKKFKISAAHRLDNSEMNKDVNKKWFGKCNIMHGHNYYITLILRSQTEHLGPTGMIMNFDQVKDLYRKWIDEVYDHQILNDCPGFENKIVSAENMAFVFYKILRPHIKELYAVEVEETEGASATYYRSE